MRGKVRVMGRVELERREQLARVRCPAREYVQSRPSASDCFLSEAHGFLPPAPLAHLPQSHAIWEKTLRQLPDVLRRGADVRQLMLEMPLRAASAIALPAEHLLRAASLLGCFVHATWHYGQWSGSGVGVGEDYLPESIRLPWAEVAQRLGRPRAHLTVLDYTAHNYELALPPHVLRSIVYAGVRTGEQEAGAPVSLPGEGGAVAPLQRPRPTLDHVQMDDTHLHLRPAVGMFRTEVESVAILTMVTAPPPPPSPPPLGFAHRCLPLGTCSTVWRA